MCEWKRMIERGPNDIDLGRNDKGWVLHVNDIGLSDLLHFSDIGYSDVDLGPSDWRWVT
jgi:hypothetical protein